MEKMFEITADTIMGAASYSFHMNGGPALRYARAYSDRDKVCERMACWLEDRQDDVVSGNHEHSFKGAFRNGNLYTEMKIRIGDISKTVYTEVAKDGFHLYSSAENMDDKNQGLVVHDAKNAVAIHAATVMAAAERMDAKKEWTDRHSMEGMANKSKLLNNPEYKALSMPGKMESIDTMFELEPDFAEALQRIYDKAFNKSADINDQDFANAVGEQMGAFNRMTNDNGLKFSMDPDEGIVSYGKTPESNAEQDFADAVAAIPANDSQMEQ